MRKVENMDYLEGLNDKQREAVLYTEGPLLILAGAGSGKTRVVTHKIAYLIKDKGIYPSNILAISFTNKAATEMKNRVGELIEEDVDNMWMGTFHSICVRILRRDIDKIGYNRSFTIYDRDDQITLLKECFKEKNINKEIYKEAAVLSQISDLKDSMVDPNIFINSNYNDFYKRTIGELYLMYEEKLKQYNALDFDDLIIKTVELLNENQDILSFYQKKFKYVFVDEYQDTNKVQYKLIKLLSGGYENICVVGDSDQSIYGWRGADINNILDFEKDYKGAKTILLEQNYRSSQNILDLANKVIKNNPSRWDKNLWTSNKEGNPVIYEEAVDSTEEALFVSREIDRLVGEGHRLSDFAVLYRTNAQSRSFEDIFMKKSIPYKIVGGLKFYDRKEIKDIVAYLKLIENPVDNIALKRIINVPKRGIGAATISKLEDHAMNSGDSIYGALLDVEEVAGLSTGAKNKLKDFTDIINLLMAKKEIMGLREFIEEVINSTSYIEELEKENTIEAQTRIENIKEFLSVVIDFEMSRGESSLEDFLADISLLSDVDKTTDTTNVVTMMTVHSAKGLEFPIVFMVGMEDGLFPTFRSFDSDEDMEEERRLCYVAITRAEKQLFITSAKIRTIYGKTNYSMPSRFIREMGDSIEKTPAHNNKLIVDKNYSSGKTSIRSNRERLGANTKNLLGGLNARPKAEEKHGELAAVKIGDKVRHKKWGEGTIVQIKDKGNGDNELTIAFDSEGLKRLLQSIAPIEIVR